MLTTLAQPGPRCYDPPYVGFRTVVRAATGAHSLRHGRALGPRGLPRTPGGEPLARPGGAPRQPAGRRPNPGHPGGRDPRPADAESVGVRRLPGGARGTPER